MTELLTALYSDPVGVTITSGRITIREGGLDGTYRAAQFHIHVGSSSARGSEHKIHGQQYQGEVSDH